MELVELYFLSNRSRCWGSQSLWTDAEPANDLETLASQCDANVHREIAKCSSGSLNRLKLNKEGSSVVVFAVERNVRGAPLNGNAIKIFKIYC